MQRFERVKCLPASYFVSTPFLGLSLSLSLSPSTVFNGGSLRRERLRPAVWGYLFSFGEMPHHFLLSGIGKKNKWKKLSCMRLHIDIKTKWKRGIEQLES